MRQYCALVLITAFGCGDGLSRLGSPTYPAPADQQESSPPNQPSPDVYDDAELEEVELEDPGALTDFLRELDAATAESENERPALNEETFSAERVAPVATELGKISVRECFSRLNALGIQTVPAPVAPPGVRTPLLLKSAIDGVVVTPKWPQSPPQNAVMDCRLILALAETARQAKNLGIRELAYYSAYRPRPGNVKCKKGSAGASCRKRQRFEKRRRSPSQHNVALGLDLRFLTLEDGTVLDVLENWDRKSGTAPCGYNAHTGKGRLLQRFACGLHESKAFNVVLTPNANKAHHNHFHLDITPGATWYIIR